MGESVFAERLRATRELREYSQVDLGKEASIPASSIAHFESGSRKPSFDTLRKLATVLRVTTDYLLGMSDDDAGSGLSGDPLYLDIAKLSGEDIELTRQFVEMLRARSKEVHHR